eukprot:m.50282 g.50282  ORF g.50282 m.50282 type:complete len:588 (+) comp10658_c0_seq2:208-1971(+)
MAARRALRGVGRAIGVVSVSSFSVGVVYYIVEPGFRRQVQFWGHTGPIVGDYFYHLSSYSPKYLFEDFNELNRKEVAAELHAKHAPAALDTILDLKGLFIKFGQVCSVRPEIVPKPYRQKFSLLQSDVPGRDLEEVIGILQEELGPVEDHFSSFEATPCGAASIGQAHRATLSKNGQEVVVKVQYPDASWMVAADLKCLGDLIRIGVWGGAFDEAAELSYREFSKQFLSELDYEQEKSNLERVHKNIAERYKAFVAVPEVIPSLCSPRVITMTYLPGSKMEQEARRQLKLLGIDTEKGIREILQKNEKPEVSTIPAKHSNTSYWGSSILQTLSPSSWFQMARWARNARLYSELLAANTVSTIAYFGMAPTSWSTWANETLRTWTSAPDMNLSERWLTTLFDVHGYQIFCTDLFNADPHPGNILVLPDYRLGLIDYGQCRSLDPAKRSDIAKLILAVAEDRPDETIAEAFRDLGIKTLKDDTQFLADFAKLILGSVSLFYSLSLHLWWLSCIRDFQTKHLSHEWHMRLHKADRVTVFPTDLAMVCRVAGLLRGLSLALQHNVSISDQWKEHAKAAMLQTNSNTNDVVF